MPPPSFVSARQQSSQEPELGFRKPPTLVAFECQRAIIIVSVAVLVFMMPRPVIIRRAVALALPCTQGNRTFLAKIWEMKEPMAESAVSTEVVLAGTRDYILPFFD